MINNLKIQMMFMMILQMIQVSPTYGRDMEMFLKERESLSIK